MAFSLRRTIRQLAAEPESVDREMTLHGARMHALHECGMTGRPVDDQAIRAALEELLRNPSLGDDPSRHLDCWCGLHSSSTHPTRSGIDAPRRPRNRHAG